LTSIRQQPPRYHAYMLRMWEERSEGFEQSTLWRFQVEDPQTGRRHGFTCLPPLFAYLQEVMSSDDAGFGAATLDPSQEA